MCSSVRVSSTSMFTTNTSMLLFWHLCEWWWKQLNYQSLFKAAPSQAYTSATFSLMDPSHCSAASQSPEGTLLLVMQSSQCAVFSKCFSGLTSSWCGHLSVSARWPLPGLLVSAWSWISNWCHAACWSCHWAIVCTSAHVKHSLTQ